MKKTSSILLMTALLLADTSGATDPGAVPKKENPFDDPAKLQTMHQFFSADYFNKCWDLIDKQDRTADETESMIALSYASLAHWKQRSDCSPMNLSVAYWQLSRVHSLAGMTASARSFGQKCLKISQANKLPPFYIGYAYEALTYADILDKDYASGRKNLKSAHAELDKVTDKESLDLLKADILKLEKALPSE
jgi:hypothetical protein